MAFAFKKFTFFQQSDVAHHGCPINASCHAFGHHKILVGCANGTLHILNESYQPVAVFTAYGHKVLHVAWAEVKQHIITVGVEEPGISTATIKVWELDKLLRPTTPPTSAAAASGEGTPVPYTSNATPLRIQKVFNARRPESEVTAFAVSEASAFVTTAAVGLASGQVLVFQGDVARGKLAHTLKLSCRPDSSKVVSVTSLHFVPPSSLLPVAESGLWLWAVTEAQTLCLRVAEGSKPNILDQAGCSLGSCVQVVELHSEHQGSPGTSSHHRHTSSLGSSSRAAGVPGLSPAAAAAVGGGGGKGAEGKGGDKEKRDWRLVVARDDALYEYTLDTRAGCVAIDGPKLWLGSFRQYRVVVTRGNPDSDPSGATLTLLDAKHKFIAGAFHLAGFDRLLAGPAGLAALLHSGQLLRFQEIELNTQLDVLFKRSLFKLALDLASCAGADAATLAGIRGRWGDALYAKGEYDQAMAQYLGTLGQLEPSFVIRRFLDAQRIHNLTNYLEQLHTAGLAAADHTTLLLNCYTKLKDVAKLDAFIARDRGMAGSSGNGASGAPGGATASAAAAGAGGGGSRSSSPRRSARGGQKAAAAGFDMETAFKVLRGAGYYTHALWVAERAGQVDWRLDVWCEDMHEYDEAVRFIGSLPRPARAKALQRHGKLLISKRPEDTTSLLMDLCIPSLDDSSTSGSALTPATTAGGEEGEGGGSAAADARYVASVAEVAHLYQDRPTMLMVLCEFVLSSPSPPPNEQVLYHTLLDLYLAPRLADEVDEFHSSEPVPAGGKSGQQVRHDQALDLLQRGWAPHLAAPAYDPEQALVLCRVHAHKPGLLFLYDKLRMYKELLQVYMDEGDRDGLLKACQEYGDIHTGGDPSLWRDALEYLVGCSDEGVAGYLAQLLGAIEARSLLPPLVVLGILAKNTSLKVSLVKGYVSRALERAAADIAADRAAIAQLSADTASLKAQAAKLRSSAQVIQNSRCAASGALLELPVVHFMCGHSFNLRSLGENDKECPLCAPDFRRVLDIRRAMRAAALQQDKFFTELREASDGFGVVAEHFGRGLMNMTAASLSSGGAAAELGA